MKRARPITAPARPRLYARRPERSTSRALAAGAVEGGTARIDPAANRASAMARLPFPAVDPPLLREIAELSRRPRIIAKRRAPRLDGGEKNGLDRLDQPLEPGPRDPAPGPRRRDPRHVQSLADVDVAEPRDDALVEQQRLDRRRAAGQRLEQIEAAEPGS